MKKTILVCVAHSDDEAVGASGSLLKYVNEGKEVVKIVFSKGQSSHPHLKEHIVVKERKKETATVDEFIGIKTTLHLGLEDAKLKKELENPVIKTKIKLLLKKYNPEKILIPSNYDPHPDHRALHKVILELVDSLKLKTEVFAFEVWGMLHEPHPYVYVDISPYFKKKLQIMRAFESQWLYMYILLFPVILKAKIYGVRIGKSFAEKFYKLR